MKENNSRTPSWISRVILKQVAETGGFSSGFSYLVEEMTAVGNRKV